MLYYKQTQYSVTHSDWVKQICTIWPCKSPSGVFTHSPTEVTRPVSEHRITDS